VCASGVCSNLPRGGVPAVTCRLQAISHALAVAAPEEVGGPAMQERLAARVAGLERALDSAPASSPRSVLRRASRQMRSFGTAVARGRRRGAIRPEVADELTTHSREAVAQCVGLLRRL
jgi:hypothetical protein